jgi:uncharacterized RDD family membrane protein YckC
MEYEDRRTIATPEGIDLELPLAGVGTRAIGLLIDSLIQAVVIVIGLLAASALGSTLAVVGISSATLLLVIGYDVLFEVLGGGRTPGKRVAGVRVVMDGGQPVGLRASLIRNIIRLVEGFLLWYVPAMISVLVSRDNQRLGDHAAGTLVVRDRIHVPDEPYIQRDNRDIGALDVTGISEEEIALVRSYLARRVDLAPHARRSLAAQLAGGLRPRVAGARAGLGDDQLLEQVSAAKAKR